MPIAPSFQDLLDQFLAEAQSRRPDLVFADGDITVAQQHGAAACADAVLRYAAQALKETFIDGASGTALDALVDDHLNLQRVPANPAQVTVQWSRTTSGPGGTIAAGSVVATQFGADGATIEYTTDAPVLVGAGLNGPFASQCTAVEPGRSGNAEPGTITRVVDQPSFDPNFTCTNIDHAAGGADPETDEELRVRSRDFFRTLRRGTLAALEFGAKQVPGVASATATEDSGVATLLSGPKPTGIVTVRVADSEGNSNQQMIAAVTTELDNWRCAGIIVLVIGGSRVVVDVAISLTVRANYSVEARRELLEAAAVARVNKLQVGEVLYLDSLIAAVIAIDPDNILDVRFDNLVVDGTPVAIADIVPQVFQLLRAGTFTFTEA